MLNSGTRTKAVSLSRLIVSPDGPTINRILYLNCIPDTFMALSKLLEGYIWPFRLSGETVRLQLQRCKTVRSRDLTVSLQTGRWDMARRRPTPPLARGTKICDHGGVQELINICKLPVKSRVTSKSRVYYQRVP